MKKFSYVVGALLLGTILAACGGGGSGSPGNPPPTVAPQSHHAASISFSQVGRTTQAIHAQDTCPNSVSGPTVLQAEAGWNPPTGSNWGALDGNLAEATEFDLLTCNVVSSLPTITVLDPNIVTTQVPSWVRALPSPSPGSEYIFGVNPGSTILTATFPDLTIATAVVHVYGELGVECSGFYYLGGSSVATRGWSDTAGQVTQVDACGYSGAGNAPLDFQMDAGGTRILIPGGYDIVESASPTNIISVNDLGNVSTCAAFSSQGTSLDTTSLPPSFLMLFKTQDGKCVKLFTQQIIHNGGQGGVIGLYAVSDSLGVFPY